MELEKVSTEYLEHLKKVKRYSENTVTAYCNDLKEFLNYCKDLKRNDAASNNDDKPYDITSVSNKLILSYRLKMNDNKLGMKSIARKLSAVRGLFRFSFINGYIEINPAASVKSPRLKRKLPEVVSEESILLSFKEADADDDPLLVKIIFELLYGCALRVSELCSLNRGDIDINKELLKVKGKGKKERIIPIGSKSMEVVKAYIEKNQIKKNSPLITKGGKRIYPVLVYRIVKKYLSKVTDVEKKSPHILRHSAATHMLDRGADLNAVKEILGHESLSTTQIYTQVSVERLKKAYKKAHPKS
jgi:integrase/recombinase XerC